MLNFPEDLLANMAFYEVYEQSDFFDETFIEQFVRISDVVGTWELSDAALNYEKIYEEEKNEEEPRSTPQTLIESKGKIYLKFRYYLPKSKNSKTLSSIEDIFLMAEFYRLLYVNRMDISTDQFVQVMSIYTKMRNPDTSIKNMSTLMKEARHAIGFYGNYSGKSVKISYELVLNGIAPFNEDSYSTMKRFVLDIFQSTCSYKAHYYKINFEAQTIIENEFPSNVLLLVTPTDLIFVTTKMVDIVSIPFSQIRTINIIKNVIVLTTTTKIEESSGGSPLFRKYSFRNNQAKSLYQTITNYITMTLNGTIKESEIRFTRPYKDIGGICISKDEMNVIMDHRRTNHQINRFYKKA
jgi:hypothetical protein